MTKDQVQDAVHHLERDGAKVTYATVLTQLGGGSKRDLAAFLPHVLDEGYPAVPEDQGPGESSTPTEVLMQFRAAHATLSAQLIALRKSKDIASLDALAIVQVKLNHVEGRLPDLEGEAQAFEHAEQMESVSVRNRPRWAEAAKAKHAARDGMVAACDALMQCLAQYRQAHNSQVRLIVHTPWSPTQRAAYTALPSQLVQTVQVVLSGSEDASQWLQRVRLFDDIGCNETMPGGSENF